MSANNKILKNGLYLESCKCLLSWRIPFKELYNLGSPQILKQSNQRMDLLWKNERILNGINVDLVIMRWSGIFGMNRRFNFAFAYLSQNDFIKIKEKLDSDLGFISKYKRKNKLEYQYTWDLDKARITLQENDRFGPYWTIEIQHKSLFQRIL